MKRTPTWALALGIAGRGRDRLGRGDARSAPSRWSWRVPWPRRWPTTSSPAAARSSGFEARVTGRPAGGRRPRRGWPYLYLQRSRETGDFEDYRRAEADGAAVAGDPRARRTPAPRACWRRRCWPSTASPRRTRWRRDGAGVARRGFAPRAAGRDPDGAGRLRRRAGHLRHAAGRAQAPGRAAAAGALGRDDGPARRSRPATACTPRRARGVVPRRPAARAGGVVPPARGRARAAHGPAAPPPSVGFAPGWPWSRRLPAGGGAGAAGGGSAGAGERALRYGEILGDAADMRTLAAAGRRPRGAGRLGGGGAATGRRWRMPTRRTRSRSRGSGRSSGWTTTAPFPRRWRSSRRRSSAPGRPGLRHAGVGAPQVRRHAEARDAMRQALRTGTRDPSSTSTRG
jgi:hypothetical protein